MSRFRQSSRQAFTFNFPCHLQELTVGRLATLDYGNKVDISGNAVSTLSLCATTPQRSPDGYIRVTLDAFLNLDFPRKLAWEDIDLQHDLIADDVPAFCAGYCEWATDDTHQVSVGWAWFGMDSECRHIAPGGISTNVMLVTPTGYDMGMHRTGELLLAWLSSEIW